MDYDEWHQVGVAWGGPDHDFELCVDGEVVASNELPAGKSLPWGLPSPPSAWNFGIGGNHQRCISAYGSTAGVSFRDVEIWNEHRPLCGTAASAGLDHFTLYKIKTSRGLTRPARFGPLTLTDAQRKAEYDVVKPVALGLPAEKNGEGLGDRETHLQAYKIRQSRETDRYQKQSDVRITNQCNDLLIEVKKPVGLLVPTLKGIATMPPPPDPASHDLDHFLCYSAKAQRRNADRSPLPRFPKGIQVDVTDQFQARRYELRKITKLCSPTDKAGSPVILTGSDAGTPVVIEPATVRNPDEHLVCYFAKLARKFIPQTGCGPSAEIGPLQRIEPRQESHLKRIGLYLANQLGEWRADSVKETEICIPSQVRFPSG